MPPSVQHNLQALGSVSGPAGGQLLHHIKRRKKVLYNGRRNWRDHSALDHSTAAANISVFDCFSLSSIHGDRAACCLFAVLCRMSDLLLPFVLLIEDDAVAFWCFVSLMQRQRVRRNFAVDESGIFQQLRQLARVRQVVAACSTFLSDSSMLHQTPARAQGCVETVASQCSFLSPCMSVGN